MRQLELNINRECSSKDIRNIFHKLNHKKECVTDTVKVFNARFKDIELANKLLIDNILEAEGEIETITSIERLREFKDKILEVGEYILDMETTGLDIFNDIIVGVCIYVHGFPSAYVPLNHTDIHNNLLDGQLSEKEFLEIFRDVFINNDIRHILHNAKYDYKVILWNWRVTIKNVYYDTLIASFLLNENEGHGLKPLYNKYIKGGKGDNNDFSDYFNNTPFNYVPIDVASVYGANDGIKTYRLYKFFSKFINLDENNREDLKKLSEVFFNIEMPLIPLLSDIELRGVEIREDYAKELSEEMREQLEGVIAELDKDINSLRVRIDRNSELHRLVGDGKFNYSSPKQLQLLLYDVLKFKSVDRKNPRGTGEEILQKLYMKYEFPFLQNLLKYRGLNKLLTTYVEKLPKIIEKKTGAVHTQFNALGTATGRFSSSDSVSKLNLQNIPAKEKRIRQIFRAREGKYFIGGDLS